MSTSPHHGRVFPSPSPRWRGRRGLTLVEVMATIAILVVIVGVAIPSMRGLLDLQVRGAAKELAQTYAWLLDEAAMRNVTFRIEYRLDNSSWKVEVGDPSTLIFSEPDGRQEFEEDLEAEMSRFTEREIEEGEADDVLEQAGRFSGLDDPVFGEGHQLPSSAAFAFVYTPQYAPDGMSPSEEPPSDPEDEMIAYTYIFPDGTAEQTLIRIVDVEDPDDGWSISVEPLSGVVELTDELIDIEESLAWLPDDGPELP